MTSHIKQRYNLQIASISFDKGFWSPENRQALQPMVDLLVLPKKGKRNAAENEHEHTDEFIHYRHKHAAVESNINCLNHHSLDRCPDSAIGHFRSYVSLGILGYNLHKLGNDLIIRDTRKRKLRQRAAAERGEISAPCRRLWLYRISSFPCARIEIRICQPLSDSDHRLYASRSLRRSTVGVQNGTPR